MGIGCYYGRFRELAEDHIQWDNEVR
jgi:hypothetical protein